MNLNYNKSICEKSRSNDEHFTTVSLNYDPNTGNTGNEYLLVTSVTVATAVKSP